MQYTSLFLSSTAYQEGISCLNSSLACALACICRNVPQGRLQMCTLVFHCQAVYKLSSHACK